MDRGMWKVFGVALALRMGFGILALWRVGPEAVMTPDSWDYLRLGTSLAEHGVFGTHEPEVFRTPGYPLALSLALWPEHAGVRGGLLMAGWVAQIVLGALTCLLLRSLALSLGLPERVASLSAWLCALEPLSVLYAPLMLSETLFTFLLIATLMALRQSHRSFRFSCLAGLGLAGLAFTRAAAVYLPWPAFLLVVYGGVRDKQPWTRALPVILLPMVAMGLWVCRNESQAEYRGFAAVKEYNVGVYWGAAVRARIEGRPFAEVSESTKRAMHESRSRQGKSLGSMYHDVYQEGKGILMAHPVEALLVHVKGLAVATLDPGSTEALQLIGLRKQGGGLLAGIQDDGVVGTIQTLVARQPLLLVISTLLGLVLAGLYVLSFLGLRRLERGGLLLLATVMAYLALVSGGANATGRFRHPVMPLICIVAAAGLCVREERR
ncbi:MAG: hypothetical protein AB7F75_11630 [Planctomycetota bacterium]